MGEEEEKMDGEDDEMDKKEEDAIGEESEEDEDNGGPDEADVNPDYMGGAEYKEEDEMDGEEHGENGEEEEDIVLVADLYYGEVHVVADVHADLQVWSEMLDIVLYVVLYPSRPCSVHSLAVL